MRNEIQATEKRMNDALEALRHQFGTLRTGRASAAILEGVHVDYYGTPTPLKQVCNLSVPEADLIVAQPWDASLCSEIDRAIRKADLGLNPMSDGKVVRIPVPQPTEERRKEIVKRAHQMAEEVRIEVRRFRHEANGTLKQLKKDKTISEDDEKRGLDEVQNLTDKKIAEIDALLKDKESEILKV
jgi:ribosome recycling factor